VDQRLLLHLDLGDLAPGTRADVMSQYRFLRAIELGFGLWAFSRRGDSFSEPASNSLFLFTMVAGVTARGIGLIVDGSPSPAMYAFAALELAGAVTVYAYTRRTLRRTGRDRSIDSPRRG
jgi:hypothetical protein